MTELKDKAETAEPVDSGPQSALENEFIGAYLQEKGYRREDLRTLPREVADRLMKEACQYACLKLTEIEARAGFCQKIKSEHQ